MDRIDVEDWRLETLELLMPLARRIEPWLPWGGLSLIPWLARRN